jgi:hypothetical protein
MNETDRLKQENLALLAKIEDLEGNMELLQEQLNGIKEGIKTCKFTMIVDGNDMLDWGWTTYELINKEKAKQREAAAKFNQQQIESYGKL